MGGFQRNKARGVTFLQCNFLIPEALTSPPCPQTTRSLSGPGTPKRTNTTRHYTADRPVKRLHSSSQHISPAAAGEIHPGKALPLPCNCCVTVCKALNTTYQSHFWMKPFRFLKGNLQTNIFCFQTLRAALLLPSNCHDVKQNLKGILTIVFPLLWKGNITCILVEKMASLEMAKPKLYYVPQTLWHILYLGSLFYNFCTLNTQIAVGKSLWNIKQQTDKVFGLLAAIE